MPLVLQEVDDAVAWKIQFTADASALLVEDIHLPSSSGSAQHCLSVTEIGSISPGNLMHQI